MKLNRIQMKPLSEKIFYGSFNLAGLEKELSKEFDSRYTLPEITEYLNDVNVNQIFDETEFVKWVRIKRIEKEFKIDNKKIRWMLRYFKLPVRPRGNPCGTPRRNGAYVLNSLT